MFEKRKKLRAIKFSVAFSILCIICLYQSLKSDDVELMDVRSSLIVRKRHLLSVDDEKTANVTKNYTKCIRPDIEQFPKGFTTQNQRVHGFILMHFLIAFYMFFALSIICDDYFVPALEAICQGDFFFFSK